MTIAEGPLAGLMSRAVVIVDGDGVVTYTEQVPEIGQEPDYDSVLAALEVGASASEGFKPPEGLMRDSPSQTLG